MDHVQEHEEADLKAIYAYLRTMPAIKNQVVKFSK
jgi:hypothetical protein